MKYIPKEGQWFNAIVIDSQALQFNTQTELFESGGRAFKNRMTRNGPYKCYKHYFANNIGKMVKSVLAFDGSGEDDGGGDEFGFITSLFNFVRLK